MASKAQMQTLRVIAAKPYTVSGDGVDAGWITDLRKEGLVETFLATDVATRREVRTVVATPFGIEDLASWEAVLRKYQ